MAKFSELWKLHVGLGYPCDATVFENQCAIRMGAALSDAKISLANRGLRTCVQYNPRRFKSHAPGHIRSAQQLADVFKKQPTLLGEGVTRDDWKGSINTNLKTLTKRKGMIFLLNGWGRTDHIDLWNGYTKELRGGAATFFDKGQRVWFWEIGD